MDIPAKTPNVAPTGYDHLAPQDRPSAPPMPPGGFDVAGQKRGRDTAEPLGSSQKRANTGFIPPR